MKLLFDVYHVQIMNGDVIRRLRQYKDYIAHIHTAGVPGRGLYRLEVVFPSGQVVVHDGLEPGDHVVAPYPAYQQLYSVPRAIGCDVDLWQVRYENEFRFDLDDLDTLVHTAARAHLMRPPE